jgi:hypothetical protein
MRVDERESSGEPVQLIRIKPNGKVEVVEEALNIIAQYNMPVGFVSLVGKMRTGKSCLLNRLLQLTGKGVTMRPFSSKSTLPSPAAPRAFGCGPSPSLTPRTTTTSSSWIRRELTVSKRMWRMTPRYSRSHSSSPPTSCITQSATSTSAP